MQQDAVVAFVPIGQTLTHGRFGGARLQAHKGVREIILLQVVLRREVVRFRLTALSSRCRDFIVLMHVVRNGTEIVEELAQQVPTAITRHDGRTQQLGAVFPHGVF